MIIRRHIALSNEVLRGVVGSTAHGTGIDGQEDRDEMGVFIEPIKNVAGLRSADHYIYRTAPEGARSGPDDLDLVLYSLRKFTRLCVQGNPSILLLLWLPDYITKTAAGESLVQMRHKFISREAGQRFLGYMVSQKKRLTGEKSKNVTRPEIVDKYGYDTKFAMHALRLGLQGAELLTDGKISVPVREPDRSVLLDVRHGRLDFKQAVAAIESAETALRKCVDDCKLVVDTDDVDAFLVDTHTMHWEEQTPDEIDTHAEN